MNNNLVAIVGPTASGKSNLAVELAQQYKGEIVSADSRQVYRGITVGAAQITQQEMCGIPHHLLDIADPTTPYSVVLYKKEADAAIRAVQKRNNLPLLVGGTGMYIDAVVYNKNYPEVLPNQPLRKKLEHLSTQELFTRLQSVDSGRSRTIDKNNKRRLIRAIEINEATQKPVQPPQQQPRYRSLLLGIRVSKEELHTRIEQRFHAMLGNGHLEEVQHLHDHYHISWQRIDEIGLNYKWVGHYLQNNITKQEMIEKSITSIKQYAKRQMTWFQKNKDIVWIENYKQAETLIQNYTHVSHTKN